MAKFTRIKPAEDGYMRIELNVTDEQILDAYRFDPKALEVENDKGTVEFKLTPGPETSIHKYGLFVAVQPGKTEKVQAILKDLDGTDSFVLGQIERMKSPIEKIEKQIKDALDRMGKLKETIQEV